MNNEITKEQIKKVLTYFGDYCRWMYFDKESRKLLETRVVQHEGEKFVITIRRDGYFGVKMPQRKIELIVDARYITAPADDGSIENTKFECKIMNPEIIPNDIKDIIIQAVPAFISSTFTRTIAFCLFSRLQPVSIEQISNDLSIGINKYENGEDLRNF